MSILVSQITVNSVFNSFFQAKISKTPHYLPSVKMLPAKCRPIVMVCCLFGTQSLSEPMLTCNWTFAFKLNFMQNSNIFVEGNTFQNIDGLVQERRNSSALAMELRLFCTNPSIWYAKCRPFRSGPNVFNIAPWQVIGGFPSQMTSDTESVSMSEIILHPIGIYHNGSLVISCNELLIVGIFRVSGIYIGWRCPEFNHDCQRVGMSSKCFCGHLLGEHGEFTGKWTLSFITVMIPTQR